MNDVGQPDMVDDVATERLSGQELSAGTLLRQAREAAGLHVAALAVSMKVPVKKLEALEADKLDLMMDAVFVRALASSVCRALKMDPAPVLEKLPQNRIPRLSTGEAGINAPFHAPGQSPGVFVPAHFVKPGFLAVLALLLGAAILVFLPERKQPEPVTAEVPVASPAPVASAATEVGLDTTAQASNAVAPAPEGPNQGVAQVPANVVPPSLPPESAKSPELTVQPAPVAPVGLLVFKAKGASWVEVVDAKGIVQLRRLLSDGETASASGSLPLAVVVGRADSVDVMVRGKAFDFTGISKDGVARFEVK